MQRIAVITRTKNRPVLLARCLDSLSRQTYKDFLWVVVNDNGSVDEVDRIADLARTTGINTHVVHRSASRGIAAAANHGISETKSDFIHIHDDDDTLHPEFYERAIEFLDSNKNYNGVVANTTKIEEEVFGSEIRHLSTSAYSNLDSTIFLADLLWRNQFTTISFVYRRDVLDAIGLYNESLPVLDDWEFNIRFCEKFDIGVIRENLAHYHFRVGINSAGTAQTVSDGSFMHQEYTAIIRNRFLRRDLERGRVSLGELMVLGRLHQLNYNYLKIINDKVDSGFFIKKIIKVIYFRVSSLFNSR